MQTAPSSYEAGSPEAAQAAIKDRMVARALFAKNDRAFNIFEDMKSIPSFAQTQRALDEQLADLRAIANRLGLYDAADYIQFEQKERR
jgi:hypothetical protein